MALVAEKGRATVRLKSTSARVAGILYLGSNHRVAGEINRFCSFLPLGTLSNDFQPGSHDFQPRSHLKEPRCPIWEKKKFQPWLILELVGRLFMRVPVCL